jgi:hypothetical protein
LAKWRTGTCVDPTGEKSGRGSAEPRWIGRRRKQDGASQKKPSVERPTVAGVHAGAGGQRQVGYLRAAKTGARRARPSLIACALSVASGCQPASAGSIDGAAPERRPRDRCRSGSFGMGGTAFIHDRAAFGVVEDEVGKQRRRARRCLLGGAIKNQACWQSLFAIALCRLSCLPQAVVKASLRGAQGPRRMQVLQSPPCRSTHGAPRACFRAGEELLTHAPRLTRYWLHDHHILLGHRHAKA